MSSPVPQTTSAFSFPYSGGVVSLSSTLSPGEKTPRELLKQYERPVVGEVAARDRKTARAYSYTDCLALILAVSRHDDGKTSQHWATIAKDAGIPETTLRRIVEDHRRGICPWLDQAAYECGVIVRNHGRQVILTLSGDPWNEGAEVNPPHIESGDRMQEGREFSIAANAETRADFLLAQLTEELTGIRSDLEGDTPRSAALDRLRIADSLVSELKGLGGEKATKESADQKR